MNSIEIAFNVKKFMPHIIFVSSNEPFIADSALIHACFTACKGEELKPTLVNEM